MVFGNYRLSCDLPRLLGCSGRSVRSIGYSLPSKAKTGLNSATKNSASDCLSEVKAAIVSRPAKNNRGRFRISAPEHFLEGVIGALIQSGMPIRKTAEVNAAAPAEKK